MPELPEVETIKSAVNDAVKEAQILKVVVLNGRFKIPILESFEETIINAKIITVKRIAKYIVISLDNNKSIIWHLGMSGRIKILESEPDTLEKHDHVVIVTSKGTLVYNDARRFGLITCCESDKLNEHSLLNKVGPDPFDDKVTAKYLYDKIRNKKSPIKVSLLDQTIINGIGNIYASEILYEAKILPTRESSLITMGECDRIVNATRNVLLKAIKAGGSTLKDYHKPDGSTGYFQNEHCVYNKTGQKCPNCTCDINKTGGIQRIVQAGRSTFYCPIKQK